MKKSTFLFCLLIFILNDGLADQPQKIDPFGLETNAQTLSLTDYALSDLKWVGTLSSEGVLGGLFQTPDGRIHRAIVGDFLGDEGAWISEITFEGVTLEASN